MFEQKVSIIILRHETWIFDIIIYIADKCVMGYSSYNSSLIIARQIGDK